MSADPFAEKLFEMKLLAIYDKHTWIKDALSFTDFKELFPVTYKKGRATELDKPAFDLDREVFLEVLVAFKQSFR